jgi:two-component system response regulator PilR (NtrC family)
VIELNVPPLRERRQDIPAITKRLLEKNNPHLSITDAALKKLSGFEFLGNVRELENVLERSQALMEGDTIQDKDVEVPNHQRHGNDVSVLDLIQQKAEESGSQREGLSLEEYVEKIEKSEIMAALEETKYNKTAAAKLLGISFRSLRYKLQKLGMD